MYSMIEPRSTCTDKNFRGNSPNFESKIFLGVSIYGTLHSNLKIFTFDHRIWMVFCGCFGNFIADQVIEKKFSKSKNPEKVLIRKSGFWKFCKMKFSSCIEQTDSGETWPEQFFWNYLSLNLIFNPIGLSVHKQRHLKKPILEKFLLHYCPLS